MPIYEYRCQICGAELEKLQKISDPPLLECPECGRETLQKLVSASSFRLKGGGWYESDFKTGKKKNGVGDGVGEGAGDGNNAGTGDAGNKTDSKSSDSNKADPVKTEDKKGNKQDNKQEKPAAKSSSKTSSASTD